jgi:hypothetical protein
MRRGPTSGCAIRTLAGFAFPLRALLILSGALPFLPALGTELLPLGLLLIARDVFFLRKPVGHAVSSLAVRRLY